jgi:cyclic-di-AMP phosphodiesterase PgpH
MNLLPFLERVAGLSRKFKISADLATKIAIAGCLLLLLALMFPRGESLELEFRVGAIWAQKDLIAPFSFSVRREEKEYQKDVLEARGKVLQVYERDTTISERQNRRLDEFFRRLAEALKVNRQYRIAARQGTGSATQDSLLFVQLTTALEIPFNDHEWRVLDNLHERARLGIMQRAIADAMTSLCAIGIVDRNKGSVTQGSIALRDGKIEEITPIANFLDRNDAVHALEVRLLQSYRVDSDTMALAYKIGVIHLAPNIKYSEDATAQALATAEDAIPRSLGFVQENERIVSKHERITPEIRLKLESLRRAKAERGPASDSLLHLVGIVFHVALVIALFAIYLHLFRKRIFANNRRLALIALLFLLEGAVAYLSRELDVSAPIEYLIVVPAASMLLTIIFDSRVAYYGTVIMAFIVGGIRGNDYSIALASLVAGVLSVYSVRDMKNRTQLFRSLGFIFAGYALTIVALGLERYESVRVIADQLTFALVNAIVSPVLTYGLLIFMERTFQVTTDLTLLELAHFNHPLLRLLAEKAPGTYHHSTMIATLAEAAASAIGANENLVRAGAYFHDVGKVVKPTYFIENQRGSRSKHDKLAPRMSSLIIAAHVKDGIALAREYGLPEEVIEFIPMHHGTTRIDFFYNKALQLAQNSEDETKLDEINEQDYRYPGPKPQTKETGIMMLADAVEAAVRTIDEPNPQRLSDAIDELVKRRLDEGELDECPLTLHDLTKIKSAFHTVTVGIYHTRVRYPDALRPRVRRPRLKPEPTPEELPPATDNPEGAEPG